MSESFAINLNNETRLYWEQLKDVSSDVKLHLIALLSQSMTKEGKTANLSEKQRTAEFLNEFYGAWNGSETAEEIMSAINENRSIRQYSLFVSA